jgi:2-iminobutanoate/2-iminopropanoate deaminase
MRFLNTDKAPKAIGPYSQCTEANGTYYLSGQIGFDPTTMQFAGSSVEEQCKQVFKNIEAVLAIDNLSLNNIIKASVFLTDMANFGAVNEIYATAFGDHKPARECVAVKQLPANALVEITVIAVR